MNTFKDSSRNSKIPFYKSLGRISRMSVHFYCNYDVHSVEGQLKITEKRSGEKQAATTKPFSNKRMFLLFELYRRVYINLIFSIEMEPFQ